MILSSIRAGSSFSSFFLSGAKSGVASGCDSLFDILMQLSKSYGEKPE